MTDAQLTALVTAASLGGGALIAFLRWAFNTWMADRKDERAERKAEREAQTNATVEMAKAFAVFTTKIDAFAKQLDNVERGVEEVAEEITGNHHLPIHKPSQRAQTAPLGGGYGPKRPRQDTP